MKKSKTLKSISLVALSAVMIAGVAMAAAGCGESGGGGGTNPGGGGGTQNPTGGDLTVTMFCGDADKATNQQIADAWAKDYNAAHGTTFNAIIKNNTKKEDYFKNLADSFVNGSVGDVMYVAPRNVKTYAISGRIIDLTQFINADETAKENVQGIWQNALSYYGYETGNKNYMMGQPVTYDEANGVFKSGEDGNTTVGLYGLPKDYSNFSMGYNRVFFSEELKQAYQNTKASDTRTVKGAEGATGSKSAERTYTAKSGLDDTNGGYVITYAAGDHAGEEANIINIGIPTTYKPFNFFKYNTYDAAVQGGDPMATMVEKFTGGKGYTVTIPGFPDGTFKVTDKKDENAAYDTSEGHIVYTYAEYGAMQWALTYYLNTFAWDNGQNGTSGTGGKRLSDGKYHTIYGGEQYEGVSGASVGSALYLLPWLYSNDADLIDDTLSFCVSYNTDAPGDKISDKRNALMETSNTVITDRADWRSKVGNATYKATKKNLDGTTREVDVQFGYNSERFLETYGAFLAIGSDWNGNPGDTDQTRPTGESGWTYFCAGRSIFYGAGSWDAATRNEEDQTSFDFGQMPMPVAEKYALYSCIKGANYEMTTYSNYSKDNNGTAGVNGINADALKAGLKVYTKDEIEANLLIRQDKWAARMDSVGYAVTNKSLDANGNPTERTRAAASLCAALTINEDPQVTLTYAGAQLPNFEKQCKELLNYQDPAYAEGAFKDMITPDGSATVTGADGKALWDSYYAVAKQMGDAARGGSTQTVSAFLADKVDCNGDPIKYDPDFTETVLSSFAGTNTRYAFAMKVLRLVNYRHKDLDINIRMQDGLNAVRDSSMYTYNENWMIPVDARSDFTHNLAYYRQQDLTTAQMDKLDDNSILRYNPSTGTGNAFLTPLVFAMANAKQAQANLQDALDKEYQENNKK